MRYWSWASSSVRTAWISRLSLSAGARLRFDDLAPAEDPFLAGEGLTAAPKGAAAEVLPSATRRVCAATEPFPFGNGRVLLDQEAQLVGRARAPEGRVAGGAEELAGRRCAAVGEDLGQALDAVLLHCPLYRQQAGIS